MIIPSRQPQKLLSGHRSHLERRDSASSALPAGHLEVEQSPRRISNAVGVEANTCLACEPVSWRAISGMSPCSRWSASRVGAVGASAAGRGDGSTPAMSLVLSPPCPRRRRGSTDKMSLAAAAGRCWPRSERRRSPEEKPSTPPPTSSAMRGGLGVGSRSAGFLLLAWRWRGGGRNIAGSHPASVGTSSTSSRGSVSRQPPASKRDPFQKLVGFSEEGWHLRGDLPIVGIILCASATLAWPPGWPGNTS